MTFHIITLFPESLESYLDSSIVKRAREDGFIRIKYYNPRDFAVPGKRGKDLTYAEKRVDDRPYGGGPGMVMEALPVVRAIEKAVGRKIRAGKVRPSKIGGSTRGAKDNVKIIFFSPSGKQFSNESAESFKNYSDLVLVCGRYEGIDARIKKVFPMTDISIGPYTLTGGELAAMTVVDAVARRIPGVLGDALSIEESRVASPEVYTRPPVFKYKGREHRVPKILLTGHHAKIDEWKMKKKRGRQAY